MSLFCESCITVTHPLLVWPGSAWWIWTVTRCSWLDVSSFSSGEHKVLSADVLLLETTLDFPADSAEVVAVKADALAVDETGAAEVARVEEVTASAGFCKEKFNSSSCSLCTGSSLSWCDLARRSFLFNCVTIRCCSHSFSSVSLLALPLDISLWRSSSRLSCFFISSSMAWGDSGSRLTPSWPLIGGTYFLILTCPNKGILCLNKQYSTRWEIFIVGERTIETFWRDILFNFSYCITCPMWTKIHSIRVRLQSGNMSSKRFRLETVSPVSLAAHTSSNLDMSVLVRTGSGSSRRNSFRRLATTAGSLFASDTDFLML